jgi:hypothetical protein
MSKTKKKAVVKMKAEKIVKPYATLTEEQYDELKNIITWDNPIGDLKDLSTVGNLDLLEIGFKIGEVYSSFVKTMVSFENILNNCVVEKTDEETEEVEEDKEFEWDSENEN